ncbi:MAG: glutamyl-tRNA reductase [bacterium]
MDILLLGVNHKNTPVEIREQLAFTQTRLGEALLQLTKTQGGGSHSALHEVVILSTCNRVEIYAVCKNIELGAAALKAFLSDFHGIRSEDFEDYLVTLSNRRALDHLFRVTSGIDSMVVGESQIQGQVKEAFEQAQQYGATGPVLSTLFGNALKAGKRARTETDIGKRSLSVSGAALNLARSAFPDISEPKILLIGLGEMSVLAMKKLSQLGAHNLTIINRSQERIKKAVGEIEVRAFGFDRLHDCMEEADLVFCSTGAPHAVLTFEEMKTVLPRRSDRPLLIIDIAVPRDVDPEIGALPNVRLYNIDQLKKRVEKNLEIRCSEINRVSDIVDEEAAVFWAWYKSLKAKPVISNLRQKTEIIREQELQRALRRFEGTLSDKDAQVVQDLTRRIVNKILHHPLTCLKEKAAEGNGEFYTAAVQNLFNLDNFQQNV